MKACTVCNELKELDQFDRRTKRNGEVAPTGRCKACRRTYIREYYSKTKGKTKLKREDCPNSTRKPKLSSEERQELGKAKWEAWYAEYIESGVIEKIQEEYRKKAEKEREAALSTGVRTCSSCKQEKPLSQYHMRNRKRKDGSTYKAPYSKCKTCRRTNNRYYENTTEGKDRKKRNRVLRDSRNRRATPKWLTKEHKQQIAETYELMRDCRAVTGEDYHVDHIVPLRGDNICGLHVPWNLQVLPSDVNTSKSNNYEE